MRTGDAYDGGGAFGDELPELPIPRPDEGPDAASSQVAPIAAPSLGGGASFTVAGGAEDGPEQGAAVEPTPEAEVAVDRFTWELAAQLTSGMLANPARNHASVKDAMAMFDQFLHEMHAYSRIIPRYQAEGERRRRQHGEYFHSAAAEAEHEVEQAAPQQPQAMARPAPIQPRPLPGYTPLPPGARTTYVPGSMSSTGHLPGSDEELAA